MSKFPLDSFFFPLCSCLSHAQRSGRSIIAKRRNKTSSDSTQMNDVPIMKHRRALRKRHSNKKNVHLSCQYCIFCPICKGNNFFVVGSTQALLWVSFHYHHYHIKISNLPSFNIFHITFCKHIAYCFYR